MQQLAFIFGRTPNLASAEALAVSAGLPFEWTPRQLLPDVLLLEGEYELPEFAQLDKLQRRLGGTMRLAVFGDVFARSNLESQLQKLIYTYAPEPLALTYGISSFADLPVERLALSLKKQLKAKNYRPRAVLPTDGRMLSTAQVIHNRLVGRADGLEVLIVPDGQQARLGRTITVQDIDDYSLRDFEIPVPDPESGMLSPKLAQIMINLAVGAADPQKVVIYDPFCGNGRLVGEARLMGYASLGSDIEPAKVDASRQNLQWMADHYNLRLESSTEHLIWDRDATHIAALTDLEHRLKFEQAGKKLVIVTEPFLGRPFRSLLTPEEAEDWATELTLLYGKFLYLWAGTPKALKPKAMVLVIPRVRLANGGQLALLDRLVDRLDQMGYSADKVSEYGRPDAVVHRDIVRLTRSQ